MYFNLQMVRRLLDHPAATWAVLAFPAVAFVQELLLNERYFAELMFETGVLSVQLLVLSLCLTPLHNLSRNWPRIRAVLRWLVRRRRAFGIACCGYATLHMLFYVREIGGWELAYLNAFEWPSFSGWLALLILLVLAATSNNASQRLLAHNWKRLQRLVYVAAILTALHWIAFDQFLEDLWILAIPLVTLQLVRVATTINAKRPATSRR